METAFFELVDEIKAELKSIDDHRLQVAIKMAKAHELFDEKDPAGTGARERRDRGGLKWKPPPKVGAAARK